MPSVQCDIHGSLLLSMTSIENTAFPRNALAPGLVVPGCTETHWCSLPGASDGATVFLNLLCQ